MGIEGNGREDLFIGASRLDAEGNRIWWRPDLDDTIEEMGRCPHIDNIFVERLYHDSDDYQTLWVGGKGAICLNANDGEVLWKKIWEARRTEQPSKAWGRTVATSSSCPPRHRPEAILDEPPGRKCR